TSPHHISGRRSRAAPQTYEMYVKLCTFGIHSDSKGIPLILGSLFQCPVQWRLSFSGAEKCSRCGKDWLDYKGSCYLFSTLRHTWNDSRADCQRKDGDLAVIDSVDKFLTKGGYMMYWIGLKRSSGSAHWSWVTGETLKGR
uniref:C-type lectin domain-containing protein n=1 Tax=Denticeps clupeoides TaxID=299321 RepID=A0AAY4AAF8_9TELE